MVTIKQSYGSFKSNAPRINAIIEIGLIIVSLYFYYKLPQGGFSDGLERYREVVAIISGKMPHEAYSIIGPSFFIPFWFLGKIYQSPIWWEGQYNKIVFMVGVFIMYWLLKDHLGHSLLRKFILILFVASMFEHNVGFFGGEPFTAMCVGAGAVAIIKSRSTVGSLAGWTAIIIGVANTPATLVGLICMVIFYIFKTRRLRYILAIVAAAALILAENWIRRGSPLNGGYVNQSFSTPFFFGLISILFSFGKGLVFFTPGLLLPVGRKLLKLRDETQFDVFSMYALWFCFVIGMVLIYSPWWAWDGGWFWGPRFFLFACIPASFAIAVYLARPAASLLLNLFVLLVLCLSLWVGITGALFTENPLAGECVHRGSIRYSLCQYNPHYSVLWHPFVARESLTFHGMLLIVFSIFTVLFIAIPLLLTIGRQIAARMQYLSKLYLPLKVWRY